MDNGDEPSSSLSFCSSSNLSNGSNNHSTSNSTGSEVGPNIDFLSLSKLSSSLEKLLIDPDVNYNDTEIVVEGISVGIHRCILASRSQFFHELFKKENDSTSKACGKPKYIMSDLVPYGRVGYEAFTVILHYIYTGKLKPSPVEVSSCVDNGCGHTACRPAINYAVELMYASATFQMKELVLLVQRRLLNFIDKALVEDVIPILNVAFHFQLSQLHSYCVQRIVPSDLDEVTIEKELPPEVSSEIKSHRLKYNDGDGELDPIKEKRISRIHRALDSDDLELVELLLKESGVTLDDAYAFHYAAAYCDPKVVKEILGISKPVLSLRNSRGYTVLHVAARRKEPSIIMALLDMGACASETTFDGRNAVTLCRRLTRLKDYNERTNRGEESNNDRICINVLERQMQRNPTGGSILIQNEVTAEGLHMELCYYENRVAFARVLFPAEAKLAMNIANADSTSEFAGLSSSKGSYGNLMEVDLNETFKVHTEKLKARLEALKKTVATGRHYFPHCSEVIDKFLEDDIIDMPDGFFLDKGTQEEQEIKKMRFMELKEDVQIAFDKDKAENNRANFSSSSSCSSSVKEGAICKVRKRMP